MALVFDRSIFIREQSTCLQLVIFKELRIHDNWITLAHRYWIGATAFYNKTVLKASDCAQWPYLRLEKVRIM